MRNSTLAAVLTAITVLLLLGVTYGLCRINVPAKHIAVLIKLTGKNVENEDELSPDSSFKGVQSAILTEGRYFYNPYYWDWNVYPMVEIPEGQMGIRVRLYGDSLPYGSFVATEENQKGIVKDVLRPGRYPINAIVKDSDGKDLVTRDQNDYAEIIYLHDPVSISAGFKGIVTNLSGQIPVNPNSLLVAEGFRGVQEKTLDPGTYYVNPFIYRITPVDCRSQRFNLAETDDMGFPSKDGFWVSLDGIIEFRLNPDKAAEVYTLYNDSTDGIVMDKEIISKIIMPNARSFCRLRGSNNSGRDFIGGETRSKFQLDFQTAMRDACENHGIEIVQALITKINPPQAIAGPVRDREVAHQKLKQFLEQKLQQDQEALLAIEKATIEQKKALVEADQEVIKHTTEAMEEQQVAQTKAQELLEVAKRDLEATTDKAAAIMVRKKAEAGVIDYENKAEAAGWQESVAAMGSGEEFAKFVLYQKIAPAFKSIISNTDGGPLMDILSSFDKTKPSK